LTKTHLSEFEKEEATFEFVHMAKVAAPVNKQLAPLENLTN